MFIFFILFYFIFILFILAYHGHGQTAPPVHGAFPLYALRDFLCMPLGISVRPFGIEIAKMGPYGHFKTLNFLRIFNVLRHGEITSRKCDNDNGFNRFWCIFAKRAPE